MVFWHPCIHFVFVYNTVVLFEGEYKKTRKILCTVQGQSEHLKCTGPTKIIKTLPFFSPLCLSHRVLFIGMVCQVLGLGCCLQYFKRSLCFRKRCFPSDTPSTLSFHSSKQASEQAWWQLCTQMPYFYWPGTFLIVTLWDEQVLMHASYWACLLFLSSKGTLFQWGLMRHYRVLILACATSSVCLLEPLLQFCLWHCFKM